MQRHPHVQDLRDRLTPIDRAVSFGRVYYSKTAEVAETITKNEVMQLVSIFPVLEFVFFFFLPFKSLLIYLTGEIYQHLQYEGLLRSARTLENESALQCTLHRCFAIIFDGLRVLLVFAALFFL